jgi:hypothetical protein
MHQNHSWDVVLMQFKVNKFVNDNLILSFVIILLIDFLYTQDNQEVLLCLSLSILDLVMGVME